MKHITIILFLITTSVYAKSFKEQIRQYREEFKKDLIKEKPSSVRERNLDAGEKKYTGDKNTKKINLSPLTII